jgi:hypothetical protein
MARLNIPDSTEAPESTQSTLAAVQRQLGFTPALHRLMSNSPAVLAGFTALQGSLAKTLEGSSEDPRRAAAAQFTKRLIETRGNVDEQDLANVRDAGYDDKQIIEITALAAQFLLTNFLNNVAETEPDFPSLAESTH